MPERLLPESMIPSNIDLRCSIRKNLSANRGGIAELERQRRRRMLQALMQSFGVIVLLDAAFEVRRPGGTIEPLMITSFKLELRIDTE